METRNAICTQNWPAYTKAQVNEGEMFMQLLASLCKSVKQPKYKFGRPTKPMADMVFCSALKVYSTFSLRRFMSLMKIAKERGYIDDMCSFTSVSNYMLKEEMEDVMLDMIHKSSLPLASVENDFAVDSTGFATSVYARWFNFKYGKETDKRKWWKLHVMCGIKTNIVTAAIVTDSKDGDSPMFKYLMKDTSKKFKMKEVSADKAYSSRDNMELVDDRGAVPYIPFKTNTTGRSRGSYMWRKMYHYFMYNQEEFMKHYHKRSNVESTMNMIKSKFDTFVRSKNEQSQKNEVLAKVLCHNLCVLNHEMHELKQTTYTI
jgi:transposase